jgi:hypothetical protein
MDILKHGAAVTAIGPGTLVDAVRTELARMHARYWSLD